jgi:replication factor C small subunit
MHDLWVERYRSQSINDYVFKDNEFRENVTRWISDGKLDNHVIFHGIQGTGKTTAALLLLKEFDIDDVDILKINASEERGIDTIREKILNFCSTWALGDIRYVLLDEAEAIMPDAQRALKNIMESFSENVRFILTSNNVNKLIPPIRSRLQEFVFNSLNEEEYLQRLMNILDNENISYELEDLGDYYAVAYPDMRKAINLLQQNSTTGKLRPVSAVSGNSDVRMKMVELFRAGKITEARKFIVSETSPNDYDELYRFFYNNLDFWGSDTATQEEAILIIADGLKNHVLVSDPEINLSSTLVQLGRLGKN